SPKRSVFSVRYRPTTLTVSPAAFVVAPRTVPSASGVPKAFQRTAAPIRPTWARWRPVGVTVPVRLSRSRGPWPSPRKSAALRGSPRRDGSDDGDGGVRRDRGLERTGPTRLAGRQRPARHPARAA